MYTNIIFNFRDGPLIYEYVNQLYVSPSVARLGGLPPNWASFDGLGPERIGRVDQIWAALKN